MKFTLFCIICCVLPNILSAQDSNYWTNQFGARGALLGGAVIAGLDDNSAVYYNPANLAFIKQSTVSLNTSVYKYDDVFIGNGAGKDVDLQSQRISLYQQMISGLITKNPEKRWRMGFNILTRQHVNLDMNERHENNYEIFDTKPGLEHYVGTIELRNAVSETWGCLGTGFKINENFSVGLTAIVSYRNQKNNFSYAATTYYLDSPLVVGQPFAMGVSSNSLYFDTRTNIIGGLLKLGFHGRVGAWRFGLNVTSPSITIWGESRVQRELSSVNIVNKPDIIRSEQQKQVKSTYQYPLTVGTGIAFLYKNGLVSLSGEYFMAIAEYKMIDSDSDKKPYSQGNITNNFNNSNNPNNLNNPTGPPPPSQDSMDFLSVYRSAKQVFNVAIGWEHQLAEKFKLHLGFRTDFSNALRKDTSVKLKTPDLPMDLWHFSAGISWLRKASQISFGINYTYGHRDKGFRQLVNFTEPTSNDNWKLVGIPDESAYLNYHSITLLIGYTYYFALK